MGQWPARTGIKHLTRLLCHRIDWTRIDEGADEEKEGMGGAQRSGGGGHGAAQARAGVGTRGQRWRLARGRRSACSCGAAQSRAVRSRPSNSRKSGGWSDVV